VVAEALAVGGLLGLPLPSRVRAEVCIPQGSRLDFVLEWEGKLLFLEIKSVNWVEGGVALFPDGVTSRGRRHLEHLRELAGQGHQAWNVFVVQRQDAQVLRPAAAIDPAYARELAMAAAHGVNIMVLQEKINPPEITLASPLPFDLT
jgi:sugar fermentation stimulation protein A